MRYLTSLISQCCSQNYQFYSYLEGTHEDGPVQYFSVTHVVLNLIRGKNSHGVLDIQMLHRSSLFNANGEKELRRRGEINIYLKVYVYLTINPPRRFEAANMKRARSGVKRLMASSDSINLADKS